MTLELVTRTLTILRQKYQLQEGETLYRMLDCEESIAAWAQAGGSGEMPCAEELRGWGIPLPEVLPGSFSGPEAPSESDPSVQEVQAIVRALDDLARKTTLETPERRDIRLASDEVRAWQQGGQQGPLPHNEWLRAWGVWPVDAERTKTLEFLPQAQNSFEEASASINREARPAPESGVAEIDLDAALRGRYEEANNALMVGEYFHARAEFKKLQQEARGSLAPLADAGYTKSSTELTKQTRRLVAIASNETGLEAQIKAWRAVLAIDPEHKQANTELSRLEIERSDQQAAYEIDNYLPKARAAAERLDIVKLNEFVGAVAIWKAKGEKDPPELSQALYEKLAADEKEIVKLRNVTRDELGMASTLLTSKRYRQAYRYSRMLLSRGVETVIDEVGVLGVAGTLVTSNALFNKVREEFLAALTSLVAQRIVQAEREQFLDPDAALGTLDNADGLLRGDWRAFWPQEEQEDERQAQQREGDLFTLDDKAALEPQRSLVLAARKEVENTKKSFDKAKGKIEESRSDPPPSRIQTLALLRQAHDICPYYPGLDGLIEAAEDDVAEIVAAEVRNAIAISTANIEKDQFQPASDVLSRARRSAAEQIPHPKPGSSLQKELDLLTQTESALATAEGAYEQLIKLLKEVDDAINQYEAGDSSALGMARALLEQLEPGERKHSEARTRQAKLSQFQGAQDNWKMGQDEYRQANWGSAETYLRKVVQNPAGADSAVKKQAEEMANRALAGLRFEEGRQAEETKDWSTALDKYTDAKNLLTSNPPDSLTERVLADCKVALQRLELRRSEEQETRTLLTKAKNHLLLARRQVEGRKGSLARFAVEPVEDFKKAADILDHIVRDYPHTSQEADQILQEVRELWRATYLEGIGKAVASAEKSGKNPDSETETILTKADLLTVELDENNLLYEEVDVELARKVKYQLLQVQYSKFMKERPVDWKKVENNRKQVFTDWSYRSDELQQQYFHAVRERIKSEVGSVRRGTTTSSSLAMIINDPELRGDQSLVPTLIDLSWELRAWDEAEQLADELAFQTGTVSNIWRELTRAGRWLSQGRLPQAKAQFEQLKAEYGARADLLSLINAKQREFSQRAKDDLRSEAEKQEELGSDDGYVQAAEQYAQAAELAPGDGAIITSLRTLGAKLEPGIKQRCEKAKLLSAKQSDKDNTARLPLAELTKDADAFYTTLAAIQQVSDKIGLSEDITIELEDTLDFLNEKRSLWRTVHEPLVKAEKACKDALKAPKPLPDPTSDMLGTLSTSGGGWDFGKALGLLEDARRAAGRDLDCAQIVQGELDRVDRLKDRSRQIVEDIQVFRQAVRTEDFDQVDKKAKALKELWRERSGEGWEGLDVLIRFRYDHLQRDVDSLDEHIKQAGLQKRNLDQWRSWATKAVERHGTVASAYEQIRDKDIDELRDIYSLAQIDMNCQAIIKACDELDRQLGASPQTPTISRTAEDQDKTVSRDLWLAEAMGPDGYRAKAVALMSEVRKEAENLNIPLSRLKKIVETQVDPLVRQRRQVPVNVKNLVERELKLCRAIDPLNEDVINYGKRLAELS